MKASGADTIEIARKAGVRVTVAFHAWAYRKELRGHATAEGYAEFTSLPADVAKRLFDVLDGLPVAPPKAKRPARQATALTLDELPEDWLALGREKRFWPMDVCRTEAEKFVTWHKAKGTVYADWRAAWVMWIGKSHREDGRQEAVSDMPDFTDPDIRKAYLEKWNR